MNKNSGALARRYGTALFESLVSATKGNKQEFEKYVAQVCLISSFCKKKVIKNFLLASLTNDEKIQALEFFLKTISQEPIMSEIFTFLKIVLLNKRFREIKPIFYFFLTKSDEYLEIARATFISARPIQEQDTKDFEASLQKVLNRKVVFKTEIDESLKSGFIVKLGYTKIDTSFKARLNSLKELFI